MVTKVQSSPVSHTQMEYHINHAKARLWLVPIGRVLFSLIFIFSGIGHFSTATIGYAESQGVPMANILVPLSGALAIIGGILIVFGYFARFGALCLILFLIPVTYSMHAFWNITEPQMHTVQMIQFMKNLALLGGATLIAFYGAGPISVDNSRPVRTV